MTQIRRQLPAILLAVIIAAALSLAAGALTTQTAYAADKQLDWFSFDGDCDYGWAYFYGVENLDDTMTLNSLNITVMDNQGELVPADQYDLTILHTWWDEQAGKDREEPAVEPFGINKEEGTAWTAYKVVATAKEDGSYSGQLEQEFYIMHKYCLEYICGKVDFENAWDEDGWAMHNRFWIALDDLQDPVVISSLDPEPLTKDKDYSLTYYKLPCDPNDLSGSKGQSPDEILDNNGQEIEGLPDEAGDYFVKATGKDPYYGENRVLFTVTDKKGVPSIKFEADDQDDLWSDGERNYMLNMPWIPPEVNGKLYIGVGICDAKGQWEFFADIDDPKGFFEYDQVNQMLTLKGDKVGEALQKTGEDWLDIYAAVYRDGDTADIYTEGSTDCHVRIAESEYELPDKNIKMLPDWDEWINKKIHASVWDSQYPGGEDFECEAISLEVVKEDPEKEVIDVNEADGGWNIQAKGYGSAELKLTYKDVKGYDKEYLFKVDVTDVVYHVDLWPEDGVDHSLPGGSIAMIAEANKDFMVVDPEDPEDWQHESTQEGLEYHWSLSRGEDLATIEPDPENPARAVVTFKELPQGQDDIWEDVNVEVFVTDAKSDDPKAERVSNDRDLYVESDFFQIWPGTIDPDLDIGKTVTITPELRHYELGKDYSVVDDVDFHWDNADENAVKIEAKSKGVYAITRLNKEYTDFNLCAEWDAGWGKEDRDQWYHFEYKDYDIWFDEDSPFDLYENQSVSLELNTQRLAGLEDYDIDFEAGIPKFNSQGEIDSWVVKFKEGSEYVKDGAKITLYGEKVAEQMDTDDSFWVYAKVQKDGNEVSNTDRWIKFKAACVNHDWSEKVIEQATCTEPGSKELVCKVCGEVRTDVIPATGHDPVVTETKRASDQDNGNTEYWTCANCDKYFSDAECKNEIEQYSWVIPMVTMSVSAKKKSFAAKSNTKTVLKERIVYVVKGNPGKMTYKKKSGNGKISVSQNGDIKVKKGLRKKKKYKIKVLATSEETAKYDEITRVVTVRIRIK